MCLRDSLPLKKKDFYISTFASLLAFPQETSSFLDKEGPWPESLHGAPKPTAVSLPHPGAPKLSGSGLYEVFIQGHCNSAV